MDALAILSIIAGGAGSLITIITFCTLVFKPLRERFIKWIRKIMNREEIDKEIVSVNDKFNKEISGINEKIDKLTELVEKTVVQNDNLQSEMSKQSEALKASLRNSILKIYYDCKTKGYITTFQLQNVTELFENYKALGGNSFISHLMDEILNKIPVKDN